MPLVEAASHAPMHPALTWEPVLVDSTEKHRRRENGDTVCGFVGPLMFAKAAKERCTRGCWT
ncbi:MAG: hypothetical protein JWR42_1639 [Marmoricola sp.]|nr:hypothetical protein [Marmoricola sp.]